MGKAKRQPARKVPVTVPDRRAWVCAAALVIGTLTAFQPAFRAEFIRWDDPQYVTENVLLRDGAGLRKIWTPLSGELPQYYPLVFSSYWLEYRLWQLCTWRYSLPSVSRYRESR
jgi:hypothetical protein